MNLYDRLDYNGFRTVNENKYATNAFAAVNTLRIHLKCLAMILFNSDMEREHENTSHIVYVDKQWIFIYGLNLFVIQNEGIVIVIIHY